ncbi:sensor domain-containing protein [Marichromatium bheemlicum]|uniref:EAL domain-containing protein n=1 Tax=Marichromatium bheemlicum TaxID=365339 RepID=A0ABX1I670_9GAMM|nr:bifunctional diguanylate cyclase/phosphodiesterase [Marichromatium bheemlicum]NKN31710.1 EAL domain-containing protein [Marichromatium bheemlicum]
MPVAPTCPHRIPPTPALVLLRTLFAASHEGLIALDPTSGRILLANLTACQLLHEDEPGLLGHRLDALPCWPAQRHLADELIAARAGERVLEAPGPDPRTPLEVRLRLVTDPLDEPLALLVLSHRERRRIESALRESEARFRGILEKLPAIAVQGYDEQRRVTFWNRANERVYGYTPEQALGRRIEELIIPEEFREQMTTEVDAWLRSDLDPPAGELRLRRRDGTTVEVFSSHVMQRYSSGRREMFCVDLDLTKIRAAERRLRLAGTVFDSTAEGIYITDATGHILEVNRAFTAITGYDHDTLLGRPISVLKSGRHPPDLFQSMRRDLAETGYWRGEVWIRYRDRSVHPALLRVNRVDDAQGETVHFVGVFSDLSQVRHSQARVDYLTHHDALTELPNRLLFQARLDHALGRRAERRHGRLAVLFVDIDRFKGINDALGHAGGDALLRAVGRRLQAQLRRDDTIARFSGDELMVLTEHLDDEAAGARLAEHLLRALARPFELCGDELLITVSIGVALYPRDGADSTQLLRNAEVALRQAKRAGGNGYAFFTATLTRIARERARLEHELRRAIRDGELLLHYQPQVSLSDGALVGLEALVRWQHPQHGLLPPGRFIPIAESSGLTLTLGEWALHEACRQARHWLDAGIAIGRMHVNVAHAQIQRGALYDTTQRILAETGLEAHHLGLEITEGVVMEHDTEVIAELERLRAEGISLSVDDFGTGHSSLARLKELPVDLLKIDRSFVNELDTQGQDRDIIRAIIALGEALGQEILAEGIETRAQALLLRQLGCRLGQGYLFARPLAPEALPDWVVTRKGPA